MDVERHPPTTLAPSRHAARPGIWQIGGLLLLLALGVAFVYGNRSEIPSAARAIRDANPAMLGAAVALSVLYILNWAAFHRAAYRAVGLNLAFGDMIRLSSASNFLNLVAKSGGMGGLAVFLRDSGRRGQPRGRVVTAYMITALLGHVAFALTLAAALVIVQTDGRLNTAEIVASVVFAGYVAIQGTLLVAAVRSRRALRTIYAIPSRTWTRALALVGRHRPAAEPDHQEADDLYETMSLLLRQPRAMLTPGLHAILVELLGIATIWTVLLAFGQQVHPQVPLVAYSISVLFSIVGILPAGLGFAEASLGGVFTSYGIAGATAAVAVITYRLFEVWIPFAFGAWATQSVGRRKGSP